MGRRYPYRLPENPILADAARALEDGRLAGEVLDARWRLAYVSTELRNLVGYHADSELAYGTNSLLRTERAPEIWRLSGDSQRSWWQLDAPFMHNDLREEQEAIRRELGTLADALVRVEARTPPIAWAGKFTTTFPDGVAATVGRLSVRLHVEGALAGIITVFVGGPRGSVQAMLSRGDDEMLERTAALTEPTRRPAAVLFTDLESSGVLSRKLSTKAYFELIRELTTAIDEAVIAYGGVVGKHVGDGASAFFLAEQCGGEGFAASAAVRAAGEIRRRSLSLRPGGERLAVNAGVHWGATLVIGQVVTGGRLEVTALGDEVNQAARVQEVAHGGVTLATKDVIERLPDDVAAELGVYPADTSYKLLADLPRASEKARRDAGGLALCELASPSAATQ